jgi:hypothetical protein
MISAKNSIFEIGEIFNYEFKKLNETVMSLIQRNGKKSVQVLDKIAYIYILRLFI